MPDGTPSGTVLKIRNKGLPNVSGRGHGDLFVVGRRQRPEEALQGTAQGDGGARRLLPTEVQQTERDAGEKPFFERVKDIFG